MPNPTINFRLSPYQIARGLWIIRQLEPNFQPTSVNQVVKVLYLDYLAKMNYGKSDIVPVEVLAEVKNMLQKSRTPPTKLDDILKIKEAKPIKQPLKSEEPKSVISSVTDFSPPAEWLTDDE